MPAADVGQVKERRDSLRRGLVIARDMQEPLEMIDQPVSNYPER